MLTEAEIGQSMQRAGQHLQNGQLEKAEAICIKVLESNDRYADAFHLLGIISHLTGRVEDALALLDQAISINNLAPQYHALLGGILAQSGDFSSAKTALIQAVTLQPDDLEALFNLGFTCLNLGHAGDAVEAFRRAVSLAPNEPELQTKLGVAYHEAGDFDSAVNAYREAIHLDPSNAETYYNMGLSLARMDAMDAALEAFENTIRITPEYQPAHGQIGNLKRTAGEYEGAARACRRAVELNPNDLNALMDLSYALTGTGETQDAVQFSEQAVDLAPDSMEQQSRLGYAYLCNKEPEKALQACEKCLAIKPNHIAGLAFKATALNELGRREDAGFLLDFDRLIEPKQFETIAGYENVSAFNAAFSDHIRAHPTLKYLDRNRSLISGQGTGQIFDESEDDVLKAFRGMIESAVAEYLDTHPETPEHPFLRTHPKKYKLISWGNVMDKNGFQKVHMHPAAWLSGVYYPALPEAVDMSGEAHEGWIEFGRALYLIRSTDTPPLHIVKPQEGLMVMFPSYFGHRTIPFTSDEKRISVAFDVIPDA